MTAPDMESIIAAALESHLGRERETWNIDPEYFREQARAVLAAISEAGIVEWGVAWSLPEDNGTSIYAKRVSADRVTRNLREAGHVAALVSRVAFPWERAE